MVGVTKRVGVRIEEDVGDGKGVRVGEGVRVMDGVSVTDGAGVAVSAGGAEGDDVTCFELHEASSAGKQTTKNKITLMRGVIGENCLAGATHS